MTRLVREDIFEIEEKIGQYDQYFMSQTGKTMAQIARTAAGVTGEIVPYGVTVIPVTSGLGIISTFSESVAAILKHAGIHAVVSKRTDVAGIQEAYLSGREIIFMADDDVFSAFGAGIRAQSDNGDATGRGYMAALFAAMESRGIDPACKEVLILGAGPVGSAAADYAINHHVDTVIYDPFIDKAMKVAKMTGSRYLEDVPDYSKYPYIMDASTEGDIIDVGDVTEETIISAAGMPCAATREARGKASVIHNPLELGVLTMYYQCLSQVEESSLCQKM